MLENYFPNADDFDEMATHLASIANALGERVDISTWAGIQKAVQMGVAPSVLPIGTQLSVNHSLYGTKQYIVVAHNHFKNANDDTANTMTLMCREALLPSSPVSYDEMEAFYYIDTDLPAGTYNITLPYAVGICEAGTYNFTTMENLPTGTVLYFYVPLDVGMEIGVKNFQTPVSTTFVTASRGNAGTNLGTFGVELNHFERALYGSNNYWESEIHHYLNSDSQKYTQYAPITKHDMPGNIIYGYGGFLNGLDDDLKNTIVHVIIPCSANDTYESPDSYTKAGESYAVIDKVFLPSIRELGYNSGDTATDSETLPYFKNATNEMRIRYYNNVPRRYWTRTPEGRSSFGVGCINLDGSMVNIPAINKSGIVPMFNIG